MTDGPAAPPSAMAGEKGREEAAGLGMALFLASLAVLFAASVVGVVVIRSGAGEAWPPPGTPPLPGSLWLSTAVLVTSSVTMQAAVRAARAGRGSALTRNLAVTTGLGAGFLLLQAWNWAEMTASGLAPDAGNLFGFAFYVLTGLHAVHVVGGVAPLAVTTLRARRGAYGARWTGVRLTALYWHFLDVVWLTLFTVLLLVA